MATIAERLRKRKAVETARKAKNWPGVCPVCYADEGEKCISITGRSLAQIHAKRYPDNPNATQINYARWSSPCNVCGAAVGIYCVSLYTGKRAHDHRDRNKE